MRPDPSTPAAWMERAESSLNLARAQVRGVDLEDLCYQAQQAAEKALKAVFLAKGARFPFTHDLDLLLQGLEDRGLSIPEPVDSASRLSRYAVETRYPGFFEAVGPEEFREALDISMSMFRGTLWAWKVFSMVSQVLTRQRVAPAALADAEGLAAHAASARIRWTGPEGTARLEPWPDASNPSASP